MKKTDFKKLLIVPLLIIAVGPFYAAPAAAGTISDNFAGATINTRLWRPFEESQHQRLVQQGSELNIQIDGGSEGGAGVSSKFRLKGDFEVTVDYRLITWPNTNGVRLGFEGPSNNSNQVFLVKRISFGADELPNQKEVYLASFQDGSTWDGNNVLATDKAGDSLGSLKLKRVGPVLTGYFFNQQTSAWEQIAHHDYSVSGYEEWVEITLWAVSPPDRPTGGQNVEIAFSNFQVTYDQIRYLSAVPAGTMLLLD